MGCHGVVLAGIFTAGNAFGSHTRVQPGLIVVPEPGRALQLAAGAVALWMLAARRARVRRVGGNPEKPIGNPA